MIMKKKILLCCAVLASCMLVNAQVFLSKSQPGLSHTGKPVSAPVLKASSDYIQWGYVDASTPTNQWGSIGVSGQMTRFSAAYKVDGRGAMKNAKIAAVDVPSVDKSMKNVTVWVRETLDGANIASKAYSGTIAAQTFQQVVFDSPVEIPETGFYVGYTATTTGIAVAGNVTQANSLLLQIEDEAWGDYSYNGWGSLLMQIELMDMKILENAAIFSNVNGVNTVSGSTAGITAYVTNQSSTAISSIDYTVDVDGVKAQKHFDFTTPIAAGFNASPITIEFQAPDQVKDYKITLGIDKVNGVDNSLKDNVASADCSNLLRKAARRTVVEEYTGTGCPWCTRGWAGMEMMKEKYPETFIGVAYHQYNTSDPMYVGRDYPNFCQGAPQCTMDRKGGPIDPFFGSGQYDYITGDFDAANAILPFADVSVSGAFTSDGNAVDAEATVEYLSNTGDYSVVFVLTADKLTGTDQSWKQANNYAGFTVAEAYAEGTPLADFCKGGKYGSTYAELVFNDVLIASSYKSGVNQTAGLNGEVAAGNKAQASYQMALPTSRKKLMDALNRDEVYVVALVTDNVTGEIVNAARSKVSESTGITGVDGDSADATEVARYTIDGRQISTPVKGINIVKMSDGRIMKVVNNR